MLSAQARLPTIDELLRQQQQPFLPQQQEDDLLASLGGRAMSGLQYIGQTLDKPGRAVRGLLSGDPSSLLNLIPFSDSMGWTDPAKGVTGRDLLDQYGLLDKSEDGVLPFIAGLGVDVATDPFTYLSFGGGALTKTGRVAEKAGLLKGSELAATNVQRMTHGIQDLLPQLGPTVQRAAAHTAAEAAGTSLEELASQPLQSFAKAHIPFAHDSGVNLLGGPAGQYLGGKLDAVGHALRYGAIPGTNFSPGMAMANLFDKGSEGMLTETGQKIGATAFEAKKTAAVAGRRTAQEWVDGLIQSGHATDADGPMIRQVIEGVIKPPTPELAAIKASHDAEMAQELATGQYMGRQVEALDDISGTDYAHRQATGPTSRAAKGSQIFNTGSPADRAREDIYKGIYGGTEQLRDIIRDPAIRNAATVDDARGVIASKYGQSFAAQQPLDQMQGLAARIRSLPQEQVDVGLFGNHPLVDAQHGLVATKEANAATATVLDNIAKHSVPADSVSLGADTVDVNKILQTAKLTPIQDHGAGGALQYIADKLGITDPNEIAQLGNRRMPADLAGDLVRLHQGFNAPNSVHPLLQGLDSYTNLFKAGVLTWPARFVRDFISGQWNNAVTGNFNGRTVGMAKSMLEGGIAEGASKIPYVQQMLQQSGKALTDENATEALRKLIASHGLIDKFERGTNDVAGNVLGHTSGGIDELLSARPGQIPFSKSATLQSAIPHSLEEANPLNVRGFNGKLDTQFAPVKAGADATYYIDGLNRISPFIDQLEKGVAPEIAAAKIASSQAQYGGKAYTSFENSVMKRLAPFYCVPEDHEILTQNGWKRHHELTIGEPVFSLNHVTGIAEWTPLEAVSVYEFDGELLRMARKQGAIEFLFTEDHRWPVENDEKKFKDVRNGNMYVATAKRQFKTGLQLATKGMHHKIPCTGKFVSEKSILSPRLARILGWVVTDGYHRFRKGHCEMIVYQSPGKHLQELIELLGTKPRKPHPDTGVVCVPVALADVKELRKVFTGKHDMIGIVCKLGKTAAAAMLDAMFKAEGSTTPGTGQQQFPQYRRDVLDAFQIVAILNGIAANVGRTGIRCYLKHTKHYVPGGCGGLTRVKYAGKIWCPQTKHGTWMTRHNGAIIFTGNSFTKSMVPFTLRTLYEHPGGLTAQAIRASLEGRQGQGFLPEYLGKTLAVPLGQEDNGTQRYLTGMGMPHEDVTGLFQPGGSVTKTISNTLQDLLGRANPALKMPFEFASGKQLFSGRELADLDSNIGRLATNSGITDEKPNVPVWMDELLANSPLSRLSSTARMLGDERKDLTTKAASLLTPVKVADIDLNKQRSIGARDQIEELLRSNPYSKVFSHLYVNPADAAMMSPEDQQRWAVYRHLSAIAERDARARKKTGG